MKCYGCGKEKNPFEKETYPYEDDTLTTEEPIEPLIVLECESSLGWKGVVVCHDCFHRLDPDMWIGERCWNSLDPAVKIENLPKIAETSKWLVDSYPDI